MGQYFALTALSGNWVRLLSSLEDKWNRVCLPVSGKSISDARGKEDVQAALPGRSLHLQGPVVATDFCMTTSRKLHDFRNILLFL